MIIHKAVCEKCGKEEDLKIIDYATSKVNDNNYNLYDIPDGWKYFGICPKYLACPSCAATLSSLHDKKTYEFFTKKLGGKEDVLV